MGDSPNHIRPLAGLALGLASLVGCMDLQAPAKTSVPGSNAEVFKPEKGPLARVSATYGKLPLSFEANQGQTDVVWLYPCSSPHRTAVSLYGDA